MKLFQAIYPVIFLVFALGVVLGFWNGDALLGPSQMILIVASLLAFFPRYISLYKTGKKENDKAKTYIQDTWKHIRESIQNISVAIWILLLVGCLIASWSESGILPELILFGLDTIHPGYFLVGAALSSALISLVSGSSWSTAGTVGVALMGIGKIWDFDAGLVAGAVLSGAYFGDKLSPLSDTTNLASGVSRVNLSSHIRFMIPVTFFSFFLSLLAFAYMGWGKRIEDMDSLNIYRFLSVHYQPDIFTFLIPGSVLVLVGLGISALPSLAFGVISGYVLSWFRYGYGFDRIAYSLFFGYKSSTGDEGLDSILTGGGMIAMLPTVFLILSAMVFGGVMQSSGKMERIVEWMTAKLKNQGNLILNTMFFCFFTNLTTSDQYLSIVIPGRTLRETYDKMDLDRRFLSRALEDSGTISSVLIPWNSCGAFMATSLGISVVKYMGFCFFHWIQIIVSIILAIGMIIRNRE